MPFSQSDVAATLRVVQHLTAHPDAIHAPELEPLRSLITHLGGRIPPAPKPAEAHAPKHADAGHDSEPDTDRWTADTIEHRFNVPEAVGAPSEADEEKSMEIKAEAQELANDGQLDAAIAKLTEALKLTPKKAMYWALRADFFLREKRPNAAIADASLALTFNSENARALRVRGTAYRHLGKWEDAAHDLNAAQRVDFDEHVDALLKVVQPKANAKRDARRKQEHEAEEKRQEELRKQRQRELEEEQAEREREQARHTGGMPGGFPGGMPGGFPGGMPGGMPGGFPGGMPGGMPGAGAGGMPGGIPPGMEQLFSDPEIMAAMQDPEVAPKLAALMSNPAAAMQMMGDPKMGPLIQKIMQKMMGGGMGGGMPGGMPGGFPGAGRGGASGARQPPPPKSHQSKPPADDLD